MSASDAVERFRRFRSQAERRAAEVGAPADGPARTGRPAPEAEAPTCERVPPTRPAPGVGAPTDAMAPVQRPGGASRDVPAGLARPGACGRDDGDDAEARRLPGGGGPPRRAGADGVEAWESFHLVRHLGELAGAWPARLARADLGPPGGWRWLDLEATGLHGAGVRAFLAAVGRVEGDGVRVRQFLLREPAAEPLFLSALLAELDGATAVVTYNGRTFDWPLLGDRCVACGLSARPPRLPHWDVLHAARRAWGQWLGGVELGRLEAALLGGDRAGEPPGPLIPALYQAYLQGDRAALDGVRARNGRDVAALVGLTALLCASLAGRCRPGDPAALLGLGRTYEWAGEHERALACYRDAQRGTGAAARAAAAAAARVLKRLRRYDEAVPLWEVQRRGPVPSLEAAVELAKFLEHRRRDPSAALTVVREALRTAPWLSSARRAALEHRLRRLQRKVDARAVAR